MTTRPTGDGARATVRWPRWAALLMLAAGASVPALAGHEGRPSAAATAPGQHVAPLAIQAQVPMGGIGAVAARGRTVIAGIGQRVVVLDRDHGWPQPVGMTEPFTDAVRTLSYSGDLVLAAAGLAGAHVIDVQRPAEPREVSVLPGQARAALLSGHLAFVLSGYQLSIYDLATGMTPRLLSTLPSQGLAMAVAGNYAYVTDGFGGLLVLDVSDPASPREVARSAFGGVVMDVALTGSLAVVTDGIFGLRVLDVSDPTAPRAVGAYEVPNRCNPTSGADQDCLVPARVWARGDRAWFTLARCEDASNCRQTPGLRAVDLHNPAQPVALASLDTRGQPGAVQAADGAVYLAESPLWWYAGTAPCSLAGGGLQVLDEALQPVATIESPAALPTAVAGAGQHVYVADSMAPDQQGLRVWNVADPTAPRQVDSPLPVKVVGDSYGMGVLTDVAPADVVFVSRGSGVTARGGVIGGPLAAPRNGCSPPPPSRWFEQIVAADGRLYAIDAAGVFRVLDPDGHELGALPELADNWNWSLAVAAGRAYVLTKDRDVAIVDVADPAHLRVLGTVPRPAVAMFAVGHTLYIAAGSAGLRILDVADPARPVPLADLDLPGQAQDVRVQAGQALVAAGDAGVFQVDVSSPGRPVVVGANPGVVEAYRVAGQSPTWFALAGGGLYVLAAVPPPIVTPPPAPTSGPAFLPYGLR
jgi:hypothetical protein